MSGTIAMDKLDGSTIQPIGFPDLSKGYELTEVTEEISGIKKFKYDGWCVGIMNRDDDNHRKLTVTIDGVTVINGQASNASPSKYTVTSGVFPVRKGQTVSWSVSGKHTELYFYKMLE